jgi:hypothetical protein
MPKLLDKNRAPRERNLRERQESGGAVRDKNTGKDLFLEGVRDIIPITADGRSYASGNYFQDGGQEVRIFNGKVRYVDSGVLGRERATVKKREKELLELAETFIDSGSDALADKYLGSWFDYLPENGGSRADLTAYLEADGIPNAGKVADELRRIDARPSIIRWMSPTEKEIHFAIRKLKYIISLAGIIFTGGGSIERLPDAPDFERGKRPTHDKPFNVDDKVDLANVADS